MTGTTRDLLRLVSLLRVLLPEFWTLRRFVRGTAASQAPTRFAERLVALGPTFVKLGQVLSTRPDVMPQGYVEALSRLQENGPEIPLEVVHATLESELGKPVDQLFATFDPKPVAAASLSQVHRATLPDGTVVAVKIQRPDLDRLVRRDLDALQAGLGLLGRLVPRRLQRTGMPEFLTEFPPLHASRAGLLPRGTRDRPDARKLQGPRGREVSDGPLESHGSKGADHGLGGGAAPP